MMAEEGVQPGSSENVEEEYAVLPHRLCFPVRTAGFSYGFFMYLFAFNKISGC